MKVVIYINSLTSGGAERFVSYLASCLADQGDDVVVLTLELPETDYFVVSQNVRRLCLYAPSAGSLFNRLTTKVRRCRALRSVIKAEKADVLIGVQTTNAVLSVLAGLWLPTKVVVCERNYPAINKVSRIYGFLRKVLYRFADLSVAQTERAAEWLKENTKIKNIVVIPNPVRWPLPVVSPQVDPALYIGADEKCLLAVGSLSKIHQKGFDLLVSAFGMLPSRWPDWKLVILGTDGYDNKSRQVVELQNQVEQLGVGGRVCFPGRVGNVADWYRSADIFVLSSRYEGMPNVLLEAMACGCACVAFDCDTGPRDIMVHDHNGVLVPPENAQALAGAMERLMLDSDQRHKLGKAAAAVKEQFGSEKTLCQWHRVLRTMIGDGIVTRVGAD